MDKNEIREALRQAIKDEPLPANKKNRFFFLILVTLFLVLFVVQYSTKLFSFNPADPSANPSGKISHPVSGSITGCQVKVTGKTRNLEPGQYVWLAVDKPEIGLCWPKAPKLGPNTSFSTVIYEEGKKEPYTLSLYAVSKTINDQWQEWLDAARHGGLTMPHEKRRLDSVRLILGNNE